MHYAVMKPFSYSASRVKRSPIPRGKNGLSEAVLLGAALGTASVATGTPVFFEHNWGTFTAIWIAIVGLLGWACRTVIAIHTVESRTAISSPDVLSWPTELIATGVPPPWS